MHKNIQLRQYTPVHGIDYLTDHYAVLGVARDADTETIKKAFTSLIRDAHPDKYHGRDQNIKQQLERQFSILTLARDTLIHEEKRAAYDERLAQFEPHLISTDGSPKYDSNKKRIDLDYLLNDKTYTQHTDLKRLVFGALGPKDATLEWTKLQFLKNPTRAGKNAYKDLLLMKLRELELEEGIEWEEAGIFNPALPKALFAPQEYASGVETLIETTKEDIEQSLNNRLRAISMGDAPRLLSGPSMEPNDAPIAKEQVLASFASHAAPINAIAQRIADTLAEILTLTDWHYFPKSQPHLDKVIIMIEKNGFVLSNLCYEHHRTELVAGIPDTTLPVGLSVKDFKKKASKRARALVKAGTNVIVMSHDEELDLLMQISQTAKQHFGFAKYFPND